MKRNRSRRGVTYILVLGTTLIIGAMGYGGLLAVQAKTRTANMLMETAEARMLAESAINLARVKINKDLAWRSTYAGGGFIAEFTMAPGKYYSWQVLDHSTGGPVTSNQMDSVRIVGKGRVGSAIQLQSVVLDPTKVPYDAVKSALYAAGNITFNSSTPLTVSGAPLSTAGLFVNSINFTGNVEALAITNTGTLTGTQTAPAAAKTTPPDSVWNTYTALATTIPWNATYINTVSGKSNFKTNILTPTMSNFTTPITNVDGVYYVSVPGGLGKMQVDYIRINGTILFDVQGPGTTVNFGANILWTPFRADYPMTIVRNADNVELDSLTAFLAEGTNNNGAGNANYNPVGFPYNGVTNTNTTDANYVSGLWGVIHVMGGTGGIPTVTNLFPQCRSFGSIIVPGAVTYTGGTATPDATLTWDPALLTNPPIGYYLVKMTPNAGTWKQEILP